MSKRWAGGKRAYGFCDRCAFRYLLSALHYEVVGGRRSGLRVCSECLDKDHPQLQLGKYHIYDPEALKDPRPDIGQDQSQGLFGWEPVGNPALTAVGRVGKVNVSTP